MYKHAAAIILRPRDGKSYEVAFRIARVFDVSLEKVFQYVQLKA